MIDQNSVADFYDFCKFERVVN